MPKLITDEYIKDKNKLVSKGRYPKPKFLTFCEIMHKMDYKVELVEAQTTVSKYVKVSQGDKSFKVRFSNHSAHERHKSSAGTACNFYVGKDDEGTWHNLEDAVVATMKHFIVV